MILLAALAGGLGAAARYTLDTLVSARSHASVPVGTLAVNVLGSFLLGLLLGSATSADARLVAGTGFLGGFTTFSTALVDSARLVRVGRLRAAAALTLGMLVASLLAGLAGLLLAGLLRAA